MPRRISAIQLGEAAPDQIEAHLHDVLDVRLATLPPETKALVRSMLTAPEAAASMSAFLNERVANLSRAMGGEDASLRAALIVSSILGLTIARHFLKLDAFTFCLGTGDPFLTPAQARPAIAKINGAVLHEVPGGHGPWLDDPAGCARLVTGHLARTGFAPASQPT